MQCWSRVNVQQIIGEGIGYSLIFLTKINVFLALLETYISYYFL